MKIKPVIVAIVFLFFGVFLIEFVNSEISIVPLSAKEITLRALRDELIAIAIVFIVIAILWLNKKD